MYSLKTRLLWALLIVSVLTMACVAAATYFSTKQEVNRLLDSSLQQVAESLKRLPSLNPLELRKSSGPSDQQLVIQVYDPISGLVYVSRQMEPLPIQDRVGFSNALVEGEVWRLYTVLNSKGQIIETGQPAVFREDLAWQAAKSILLPIVLALPLMGLILWLIVGTGFTALRKTAEAISRRSPTSLQPLSLKGMPTEIAPVVSSLNNLLERLQESLNTQKRFASDAAHELRTPLTAITLQAQLAAKAKTDEMREKAFGKLQEGIKRATRLVTQLLALARLDPDNKRPTMPVDLHELAQSVVDELSIVAGQKQITITAPNLGPAVVVANEDALRLVINNLCDNAMRYTPSGGRIEIRTSVKDGEAEISVADNGPGIPEAERERIFERFYRAEGTQTIPGTGLGLAIVRRVSELHGGRPLVGDGLDGKGVCFTITFPAQPQLAPSSDEEEKMEIL